MKISQGSSGFGTTTPDADTPQLCVCRLGGDMNRHTHTGLWRVTVTRRKQTWQTGNCDVLPGTGAVTIKTKSVCGCVVNIMSIRVDL